MGLQFRRLQVEKEVVMKPVDCVIQRGTNRSSSFTGSVFMVCKIVLLKLFNIRKNVYFLRVVNRVVYKVPKTQDWSILPPTQMTTSILFPVPIPRILL